MCTHMCVDPETRTGERVVAPDTKNQETRRYDTAGTLAIRGKCNVRKRRKRRRRRRRGRRKRGKMWSSTGRRMNRGGVRVHTIKPGMNPA